MNHDLVGRFFALGAYRLLYKYPLLADTSAVTLLPWGILVTAVEILVALSLPVSPPFGPYLDFFWVTGGISAVLVFFWSYSRFPLSYFSTFGERNRRLELLDCGLLFLALSLYIVGPFVSSYVLSTRVAEAVRPETLRADVSRFENTLLSRWGDVLGQDQRKILSKEWPVRKHLLQPERDNNPKQTLCRLIGQYTPQSLSDTISCEQSLSSYYSELSLVDKLADQLAGRMIALGEPNYRMIARQPWVWALFSAWVFAMTAVIYAGGNRGSAVFFLTSFPICLSLLLAFLSELINVQLPDFSLFAALLLYAVMWFVLIRATGGLMLQDYFSLCLITISTLITIVLRRSLASFDEVANYSNQTPWRWQAIELGSLVLLVLSVLCLAVSIWKHDYCLAERAAPGQPS